jgi:hypothetical protein
MLFVSLKLFSPQHFINFSIYFQDPPEIIDFETSFYALEGSQTVNIECNTKSNPIVHTYEWFRDDQILSNNNKYFINSNGSLSIRHLKKSDNGNYFCTAQNTLKKVASSKLKLNVIPNKKTDAILYASSSQNIYKIPCRYSYTAKWFKVSLVCCKYSVINKLLFYLKVGSKLPKNRYSIDESGQLNVLNLNKLDTGLYLCVHDENKDSHDEQFVNYDQEKLVRLIVVESMVKIYS